MQPTSLVLELQAQALDPAYSVTDLLRKVKVVASKLNVSDIATWVEHELNGYPADADIPNYREIRGVAKALNPVRGWLKIQFKDHDLEERLSTQKTSQAISEIEAMSGPGDAQFSFALSSALARGALRYASDPRIFVARSQIVRITDAVRNRVLDWSLALEKRGVLGSGLTFSPDERLRAASVTYNTTQIIYGHNITAAGTLTGRDVTLSAENRPTDGLADALRELAAIAQRDSASAGAVAVATLAEQAATEASSQAPDISNIERWLLATAALVQGIASVGPAWTAVTTEAAKLGIHLVVPGF